MPPVPVPIAEAKPPQPTRYAIQKARGSGWKTLEVGEELPTTQARFDAMVKVNPRAYFRLIQLDERENSHFEGMEFNWKLTSSMIRASRTALRPRLPLPYGNGKTREAGATSVTPKSAWRFPGDFMQRWWLSVS